MLNIQTSNTLSHKRYITHRFVLYVGLSCNARCRFCYYLKYLETGKAYKYDLSFPQIAHLLKIGKWLGKTEVDLSGGEPTIHKDIIKTVYYARAHLGYKTVCLITNGLRLANWDFLKQLVDNGLNDILFSLHSYNPDIHDYLTRVPGSYNKLLKAIENATKLGLNVRINSVVNMFNFSDLEAHVEFITTLHPKSLNLIVCNPAEEIGKMEEIKQIGINDYTLIGEKIKKVISQFRDKIRIINVRFIPFCFMKGYEKYVRTYWQIIYEREEWDPFMHGVVKKGLILSLLASLGGIFSGFLNPIIFLGRKNPYTFLAESFQGLRIFLQHTKVPACQKCALKYICSGFQKNYIKKFGYPQVYPYVDMPLIKNPLIFVTDLKDKFIID